MTDQQTVNKVAEYVKEHQQAAGGHDWWHIYRVWQTARILARKEKADLTVVQLAALLHDLADWKFHSEKEQVSAAGDVLMKFGVDEKMRLHVLDIIANVSFKGAKAKNTMQTVEGMVVQDADRLDALGAMGVARVFEYGGTKGMAMHDPRRKIIRNISKEEYVKSAGGSGTSIEHFYQKLLLLKDRMNTKTAKIIAKKRHKFIEDYLKEFHKEWKMEDVK
ncbi:MAG: HD domain-containing protein [Candidatus Aenigmarchaeota archaeon]|nr:HD domain-containing protein [Candidatus Aenigmarchaeota archaeon]